RRIRRLVRSADWRGSLSPPMVCLWHREALYADSSAGGANARLMHPKRGLMASPHWEFYFFFWARYSL
ncbi:MAG TPA: hypothetical protein VN108_03060, partial [Marmoricola sp.]|nr:hypothetical protein [Marmoricola sp.]